MLIARLKQNRVVFHFAVIAFYGLVAVLALNRLIFNLNTVVSSGPLNDYDQFTWNYWWIGYAVNALHVDPYFTNYILYPYQHNLSMHTLAPILYPVYALLHPALGDPATLNVILWGALILTGYVTFLFLRRWTKSTALALLGGLIFAFSPAMMDHAINFHANMWLLAWLPAILLLWERVALSTRRTWAVLWAVIFGIALWGLWLTDLEFLIWIPFLLLPFGLLTLIQAKQRIHLILLGILALTVMSALILIAPLPAILHGDPVGTISPASFDTARSYSLPLSAFFFFPSTADRGIGRVIVALTLLSLLARPKRPIRWFWFSIGLLPLLLSLGPDVQIGDLQIPLPYRLIHGVFQGLYRWPSRFAPIGILALLVFVGISLQGRLRYAAVVILCLAILADGNLLAPFPVQPPVHDYAIYHQIAQEKDDYVVLIVPVTAHSGWAQVGGNLGQRAQWLETIHQKKQINGGLSRIPDIEHIFYEQPPLFSFLSGTNAFVKAQPFDQAAASQELSRLIHEWPIGYVTVHLNWLDPARDVSILEFLNTQPDLCFVSQENEVVAYRARTRGCPDLASNGPTTIDFGGQYQDAPYLTAGWYPPENIGGVEARWSRASTELEIPVKPGHDYDLSFKATAYGADRKVSIEANQTQIGTIDLPQDWTITTIHIPAQALDSSGELTLSLDANGELSPAKQSGSADERALSVAYEWLTLMPSN